MIDPQAAARELKASYEAIRRQLALEIVGLDEVIRLLLSGIFAGGHCLLVGVPGLAKTRLISTLARLLDLEFSRIQFTPDLMPSDITGAEVLIDDQSTGERRFQFLKGPVFANLLLADEINRTPPKTQAALMEAMEENQVSSLGNRFTLEPPFFVLATQNPIEQEGTYPLPAAQLDRFFYEIIVGYPSACEEQEILRMTTRPHEAQLTPVLDRQRVLALSEAVRGLKVPESIAAYATALARFSRPADEKAPAIVKKYLAFGAGPRAAQALVQGAKVAALIRGETSPTPADVRALVKPVMRHRVVVNFLAAADGIDPERVLDGLIAAVPSPDGAHLPQHEKKKGGFFAFKSRDAR